MSLRRWKENVKARKGFMAEHWKNETCAHCWFHFAEEQAQELENDPNNPLQKDTHHSNVKDGVSMQEHHVDMHDAFAEFMSPELLQHGRNLRVRRNPGSQVTMFVGQDESAFHQFIFPKKQWVDSDRTCLTLPKGENEGEGCMASGFQAREFGLGSPVMAAQREEINRRRMRTCHKNTWDAESFHGTASKPPIAADCWRTNYLHSIYR
jgi:hypothetical protein